jgi:hypothetical protein
MWQTKFADSDWLRITHHPSRDAMALRILKIQESDASDRKPRVILGLQEMSGDFQFSIPRLEGWEYEWDLPAHTDQSEGHLCFVGDREYFQWKDRVIVAEITAPIWTNLRQRTGASVCHIRDWPAIRREIEEVHARGRDRRVLVPIGVRERHAINRPNIP